MGNQCCIPETELHQFELRERKLGEYSALEQLSIKCEICKEQLQHTSTAQHLDVRHYATVTEQEGHLAITCLLCEFQAATLQLHDKHIKVKHKYLLDGRKLAISGPETHQNLKRKVKEISTFDYQLIGSHQAEIAGNIYQLVEFEKEYGGVEFDQDKSKGDLVWRHVFTKYPHAVYYCISHESSERTIKSIAKIFLKTGRDAQ